MTTYIDSGAVFSADGGPYRYVLWRRWGPGPLVLFVMLNPSTAGAESDDATIRRVVAFAKEWGCGGLYVGNLFGLVTPYPKELEKVVDPVGARNDEFIVEAAKECDYAVVAWGACPFKRVAQRSVWVIRLLEGNGLPVMCLGKTKGGEPAHPLRLARDTKLVPYKNCPACSGTGKIHKNCILRARATI